MKNQILSLNSTMTFGKYEGKTVEQIIAQQPSYIEWVIENINYVAFDDDVVSKLLLSEPLADANRMKLECFIKEYECYDSSSYYETGYDDEYAGTYAHDVMGYTDDDISDAFDGDPDAYWNID